MVPACFRWPPNGRGGVRSTFGSGFPRRGCGGQRAARTYLTSSSFRAFRFATRSPGGRGGLYQRADEGVRPYNGGDGFRYPRRGRCPHRPVAEAPSTTGPAAAKRGAGQCDNHPDDLRTIRHGTAVSTSQKMIACPKARRNRSRHRYADPRRAEGHCTGARLAPFSLPPGAAHSLFGQDQKGPPPRPARWGEEEQGSGRSFRRRRKRS